MEIRKRITCNDGTTISVQASSLHYAKPRHDCGPYREVECGYPSAKPPASWAHYVDGDTLRWNDIWENVYGYVPVNLVREYIDAHGGIKDGELPPFVNEDAGMSDSGRHAASDSKRSGTFAARRQGR